MKVFRKLVSIVAAATVLTSSLAFSISAQAAQIDNSAAVASEPNIQENAGDGVILHAFNWSYNSIKQNLPQIAAAGYSTVQTSPVTQPKDFGPWSDVAGQWSKLYQPVSLSVSNNTWLGNKAELKALCQEADKYGIKIIVDIVANHMANYKISDNQVDANRLSDEVKTYEPEMYNNYSAYFHSERYDASDSSAEMMTRGHVSACPDLNTGNSFVQNKIYSLLKECIDCGVDGFRFDAAKHIETEADGNVLSQFWANTLDKAAQNYKSAYGKDLFAYGEILNGISGRNVNAYTKRMRVTENKYSDNILAGVQNGNTNQASSTNYQLSGSADKAVVWVESHDTYMGESGSAGISNTQKVTDEKIVKAWAIVAARKGSAPLFFARPGSAAMGEAATDLTYKNTAVSEINKFHNAFAKVNSEKVGTSGSIVYVARGTEGVVLSNINGFATKATVSGTGMADGSYVDTITGNTFTVSGGTLSGQIGSTGVAVVYKSAVTPKATASVESGSFATDTMTVTLGLENAVSGTYALEDSAPASFTGSTTIRIGSDYKVGETVTLNLTATDAAGNSAKYVYSYTKKAPTSSGIYVFVKDTLPVKDWTSLKCYVYDETTDKNTVYDNGGWSGTLMSHDTKQGYFYFDVPARCTARDTVTGKTTESDFDLAHSPNTYVIINGVPKNSTQTAQYPTSTATEAQKFKLNGQSHVLNSLPAGWAVTSMTPTVEDVQAVDVTKGDGGQTEETTEPTTEEPTEPETKFVQLGILGDANEDGVININDVTAIQRYLAENTAQLSAIGKLLADVDQDERVSIKDVSYIQMYIAEYPNGYEHTGEPYGEYRIVDPSAEKFTVTAKSNLFATKTAKIDNDTDTFTVTYFMNSEKSFFSGDWLLTYDKTVLQPLANQAFMPKVGAATYNLSPASAPNGGVSGNAAVLTLIPMRSQSGNQVPLVSATFKVLKAADTEVNLTVKDLTLSKLNPGEGTSKAANETDVVANSVIGKPDVAYTLYTSVYTGTLNEVYTNASDPKVEYNPTGVQPTNPTDPTNPTIPVPTTPTPSRKTIYFTDNQGWGSVYIHYWGSSVDPDTEWPGVPMTLCDHDDGFGNPQYEYSIATDVAGIVFNSGAGVSDGGHQTVDVPFDDSVSGWYPTEDTDEEGKNIVDSWIAEDPDPVPVPVPTQGYEPSGTKTIEFTDNKGWGSVNIYIYTPDGELTAWPGFGMNKKGDNGYGGTNYYYEVPANTEFIIFSNGDGTEQTVDVPFSTAVTGWYPTDDKDDAGHWLVDSWSEDNPDQPGGTRQILFSDNKGWGQAYIHYWGSASGDTEWPGAAMTPAGTNEFGEQQYSYNIPTDVDGIVFNNGNGEQTADAYYESDIAGWYPLDTKDDQGHYNLGNWKSDGGSSGTDGFYLVGFFDGEDYWGTDHPFVGGKVTVNFGITSYAYIRDEAGNAWMTNGWAGEDAGSATLYSTDITGEKSDKLIAPAGTVTFTLVNNGDGTFTLSNGSGGGVTPVEPSQTRQIQFTNNDGWEAVFAYAYNDSGDLLGSWPGTQMTDMGDNGYGQHNFCVDVPTNASFIIFNNGSGVFDGGQQTVDIPYDNEATGWYLVEGTDESGKRFADSWREGGGNTKTVLFANNQGWGTVYIHYWGGSSSTDWPGVAMTPAGTNDYGEQQYEISIPADTTGIVFHDNYGTQTIDITYNGETGFYPTEQVEGKWNVGSW